MESLFSLIAIIGLGVGVSPVLIRQANAPPRGGGATAAEKSTAPTGRTQRVTPPGPGQPGLPAITSRSAGPGSSTDRVVEGEIHSASMLFTQEGKPPEQERDRLDLERGMPG